MKAKQKFKLLDHLAVYELYPRPTLERIARKKGGIEQDQAAALVTGLIASGHIKITKYTGLMNDRPLYQKIDNGTLDT